MPSASTEVRRTFAQDPAYRPAHPPFISLTWDGMIITFPRFRSCSVRATAKIASMIARSGQTRGRLPGTSGCPRSRA
jgi:hypothetical protein